VGNGPSLRAHVPDDDLEEVRVAVVMNGGVSLAVWIGGVAREVHAATAASPGDGSAYGAVLDIVRSTARVDVISGTSAGGLNGAFLALGQVYGADLGRLGRVWVDTGDLGALLRGPFEKDPPSLLKGDDYFLPELRYAFEELLATPGASLRPRGTHPVDLMMTTTALNGIPRRFVDSVGTEIHEADHLALFRFVRRATGHDPDPFTDPALARKLALAARSTASFPFAFEASFIPVGADGPDDAHPNMAGLVPPMTASRFVIDGGVLVNRPLGLALDAIYAQPAGREVRRVLVYVDPHPAAAVSDRSDDASKPPALRDIMVASLLTLPRAESLSAALTSLAEQNARVRQRRRARLDLARTARPLADMADELYLPYRETRVQRAADHVLRMAHERRVFVDDRDDRTVPWWSADEFAAAFDALALDDDLPFVPPPTALIDALSTAGSGWRWGLAAPERFAWLALDLLRRAMRVVPPGDPLREDLRELRQDVHQHVGVLRQLRALDTEFWLATLAVMVDPPQDSRQRNETLRRWLAEALETWPVPPGEAGAAQMADAEMMSLESTVRSLAQTLLDARELFDRAQDVGISGRVAGAVEEVDELASLTDLVFGPGTEDATALLMRVLMIEVVHVVVAPGVDVEQDVTLMQVSADIDDGLGGPTTTDRKLAGVRLAHFAAFYRASWRANDWVWGRLDGATRVVQLLLAPDRLRRLRYSTEEALAAIRDAAVGAPGDGRSQADVAWLTARADAQADACRAELAFLDDAALPVPPSLPTCARLIANRIHLDAIREELPSMVAAADADVRAGASSGTASTRLRDRYDRAVGAAGSAADIPPQQAVDLVVASGIGEETIAEDAGSDLYARTVSQSALVGVSTLGASGAGLGIFRGILRSLRGFAIVLYSLVFGATRRSPVARFAVTFAIAVGGALVAVALLTEGESGLIGAIGTVLLAAGLLMSAMLARARWPAVVFGLIVVAGLAATIWFGAVERQSVVDALVRFAIVAGIVLFGIVIGSVDQRDDERAERR
jgi:patatin-related protein